MASAWGVSWGTVWGNAWGQVTEQPVDGAGGGGFHGHGVYIPPIQPRRPTPEPVATDIQKRDNRIMLAALAIIAIEELENAD